MVEILKVRTGSFLYGTNDENSDTDIKSVFFPSKEYILGISNITHVDKSVVVKDDNNKNTKDAIDYTSYEYRNFIDLLHKGNPNLIEMLFVNDENMLYADDFGSNLIAVRGLFLSKHLIKSIIMFSNNLYNKCLNKFDSKGAYTSYRMSSQAIELLLDNQITYPLKESTILKSIKNNEIPIDKVYVMLYNNIKKAEELLHKSNLRETSDLSAINNFCIREVEKWLRLH